MDFIIKKSSRPVIIFSGFAKEDLERVINKSPEKLYVIVGAEEKEIKGPVVKVLTCGLEGSADLLATDINVSGDEINFKLNYEGGIIPFWVPAPAKKEQIHSVLLAVAAGVLQKINLVDISQAIRIIK